jgi:hypothetical protein
MSCRLCGSGNRSEFPTEMNVHFRDVRNLGKPTVLFFPKILVCLDCGFSQFTTPETELKRLAEGSGHTRNGGTRWSYLREGPARHDV